MNTQEAQPGGSITYRCKSGYMLHNGKSEKDLKCDENSNWEDIIIECQGELLNS